MSESVEFPGSSTPHGDPVDDRELEAPESDTALYLGRGEDELEHLTHRPCFTGDVYRLADGTLVALIQHPCSMSNSASAVYLACEVASKTSAPVWVGGHYKRMFLPGLLSTAEVFAIEFDDLRLIPRTDLESAERVAILSGLGVNLLLQRWVHHSTRVVVWTRTIDRQSSGPTEEADLVAENVSDLIDAGMSKGEASTFVSEWFRKTPPGGANRYQDMLKNSQERSTVRTGLRDAVRKKAREMSA